MLTIDFSPPPMLTTNRDDFQQDSLDRQVSFESTLSFIVTEASEKARPFYNYIKQSCPDKGYYVQMSRDN